MADNGSTDDLADMGGQPVAEFGADAADCRTLKLADANEALDDSERDGGMRHKILVIYTGGTFGCRDNMDAGGLAPVADQAVYDRVAANLYFAEVPLAREPARGDGAPGEDPEPEPDSGIFWTATDDPIDSTEATPDDWNNIARLITNRRNYNYTGYVVIHGTDTLSYTSSALSFMLVGLDVPVVVTGSQVSVFEPVSDAMDNLLCAIEFTKCPVIRIPDFDGNIPSLRQPLPAVVVCFNKKIFLGSRTSKIHSNNFDAFDAPNLGCLAHLKNTSFEVNRAQAERLQDEIVFEEHSCKLYMETAHFRTENSGAQIRAYNNEFYLHCNGGCEYCGRRTMNGVRRFPRGARLFLHRTDDGRRMPWPTELAHPAVRVIIVPCYPDVCQMLGFLNADGNVDYEVVTQRWGLLQGIVVEAYGTGNAPAPLRQALRYAREILHVAVVHVTDCHQGTSEVVYDAALSEDISLCLDDMSKEAAYARLVIAASHWLYEHNGVLEDRERFVDAVWDWLRFPLRLCCTKAWDSASINTRVTLYK